MWSPTLFIFFLLHSQTHKRAKRRRRKRRKRRLGLKTLTLAPLSSFWINMDAKAVGGRGECACGRGRVPRLRTLELVLTDPVFIIFITHRLHLTP